MKTINNFFICLLVLSFKTFSQTPTRILFLGNSYTYVNDLPAMLSNAAASTGDAIIYDSNTPGGTTLQWHSTDAVSKGKLMAGNWDYVVLQEQSLTLANYNAYLYGTIPVYGILDSLRNLYSPCGQTLFYMTWGRKNGIGNSLTYTQMSDNLRHNYVSVADSLDAMVSPVGVVWQYIRQNYPAIELFAADESHPSVAGTYAAACCFYAAIFKKDPTTIAYNPSLPATDAANIRAAAKAIVYDDLFSWFLKANFNYQLSLNNTVIFNNLSADATSYSWDFGDGNTSAAIHPVHTYSTNGAYTVKLTTNYCTYSDSGAQTIIINNTTGIYKHIKNGNLTFYPNPCKDILTTNSETDIAGATYVILDLSGNEIITGKFDASGKSINVAHLPKGKYFLRINGQLNKAVNFIKE